MNQLEFFCILIEITRFFLLKFSLSHRVVRDSFGGYGMMSSVGGYDRSSRGQSKVNYSLQVTEKPFVQTREKIFIN
jgi:hypothetical protein